MHLKSIIIISFSASSFLSLVSLWFNKGAVIPNLEEKYWGRGNPPSKERTSISRMKITFSDEMIKDLKNRLANTRYTRPLKGVAQEYGFNTNLLREIITFWRTKYPFKQRETYLNQYPHFKTKIQGLDIHFMHVKPEEIKGYTVLPLMIIHGWPGSFREYYDLISLLTTKHSKYKIVFEVIVPSVPGFGYSEATTKPGLGAAEMSLILKNLMLRLGHEKFYVQGGDWGSSIASYMATLYKSNVLGIHCNLCFVSTPLSWAKYIAGVFYPRLVVDQKNEARYYPIKDFLTTLIMESGYYHMQATKPDTIGVGLNDSPAGLAAYILEKFTTGTNPAWNHRPDGGLTLAFKFEDLLDNIMIYWVTNSMTTAMRIYAESLSVWNSWPIEVPSACANFRYELVYTPENILRDRYLNLVHNTYYDIGGHFIAMELPAKLSADIFMAVHKMRSRKNILIGTIGCLGML